ncbi:MAG: pyridoxamine 5'-phosphate oxidase family protein [Bacteroidales bacterium]|nr:pyridoxamine 5'-phosphate oxidase family protein [Bacteroidales bacterium]
MKEVFEFLKEAGVFYLATIDGEQPRVRPFGAVALYEDKIYIQTGKVKEVSKQISANPKTEISAMAGDKWIRIAAELVNDDRIEVKRYMLEQYPELKGMYSAEDANTQVLYLKNAKASIYSFTEPPVNYEF